VVFWRLVWLVVSVWRDFWRLIFLFVFGFLVCCCVLSGFCFFSVSQFLGLSVWGFLFWICFVRFDSRCLILRSWVGLLISLRREVLADSFSYFFCLITPIVILWSLSSFSCWFECSSLCMQSSQFILALLLGSGHSVFQGVGMVGTFVLPELLLLSFVFSVSCNFFLFYSDPSRCNTWGRLVGFGQWVVVELFSVLRDLFVVWVLPQVAVLLLVTLVYPGFFDFLRSSAMMII